MARVSSKRKEIDPVEDQVDEADDGVKKPIAESEIPDVGLPRGNWTIDHDTADKLWEEAQKRATAYAKMEHGLPIALKALGKSIRAFCVYVFPDQHVNKLRQQLAGKSVILGRDVLPPEVVDYLVQKHLPLPHFNSINPVQGIVAAAYQSARLNQGYIQPNDATRAIGVASRPITADDLTARTDEAKKLTAAEQTQQSKLARWVLASIEMPEDEKRKTGGELLFGPKKSYEAALSDWTEWREKNPDKLIASTKPKRKAKAAAAQPEKPEQSAPATPTAPTTPTAPEDDPTLDTMAQFTDVKKPIMERAKEVEQAQPDEPPQAGQPEQPKAEQPNQPEVREQAEQPQAVADTVTESQPKMVTEGQTEAEPIDAEASPAEPQVTEPVEAEPVSDHMPDQRTGGWHALIDEDRDGNPIPIHITRRHGCAQAGWVDELPFKGCLTFDKSNDGILVVTGWHD